MNLYSKSTAANRMSLSISSVKRLVDSGELETLDITENRTGITDTSVDELIERRLKQSRGEWAEEDEEKWQEIAQHRTECLKKRRAARTSEKYATPPDVAA